MSIDILKNEGGDNLSTGIVAIHAALLPSADGGARIVYFGTDDQAWSFDPDKPGEAPTQLGTAPGRWAFCAGHAIQGDGRWVIAGGVVDQDVTHHSHPDHDSGEHRCEIYAPLAGEFHPIARLNHQPGADHGGGRWYPTAVTLENGQVFAVAGHPFSGRWVRDENGEPVKDAQGNIVIDTTGTDDYMFPGDGFHRHNNNTPERYIPGSGEGTWEQLLAESTSHANGATDEYPRLHLAPSGHVFFSTIAKGDLRFYEPYTGQYDGTTVIGSHDDYRSQNYLSVLLPLLPGDTENAWVLACGSTTPQRVNIAADGDALVWEGAGDRALDGDPKRKNGSAVLLPNGQVFVLGGEVGMPPNQSSPQTELYTPAINWDDMSYTGGPGSWEVADEHDVPRGYHSVALLMPDGKVWIAGSTWTGWGAHEYEMEVFTPSYIVDGRVELEKVPPSVGYGAEFRVSLKTSTPISRVVLIRCGSATHAFDSDQRYVVCNFTRSGKTLTVTSPVGPGIAPPGYYMLFVLDANDNPCVRAEILRVCDQACIPVPNHSTYSSLEVEALQNGGVAKFVDPLWLFLENYLPGEVDFPTPPKVEVRWDSSSGDLVDETLFRLVEKDPWAEDASLPPDVAQRFALCYDVEVDLGIYDDVSGDRTLHVRWDYGEFSCHTLLELTTKPNPFMVDVEGGNPHWLSTDLRSFTVRPGASPPPGAPAIQLGEQALDYLARVLEDYNGNDTPPGEGHPFDQLPVGQDAAALELRTHIDLDIPSNFAIARVRYYAMTQSAEDVRVLFRMFNTVGTALEFNTSTTYRRTTGGADTSALLGRIGPGIISIPFFQDHPRVTPGASMTAQPADDARDLPPKGGDPSVAYFGAWLDINQTTPEIPLLPGHDGPYPAMPFPLGPGPIQTLVRNYHQCLVAEVHTAEDPIPDAADPATQAAGTPANNDNLSQRNLAWVPVGNPGSAATRTAQTTFSARPSGPMPTPSLLPVRVVPRGEVLRTRRQRRRGPDELVFDGSELPLGSRVRVYMPEIDAADVIMLARRRSSPVELTVLDEHTIEFELRRVAYLPMPGERIAPIPGLLSVELPPGVEAGETYRLVVHQLSGARNRVTGTFQLEVPVGHEPELLDDERIKLSVLRHVDEHIPDTDPWRPIFDRYLGEIADRVRGFGGGAAGADGRGQDLRGDLRLLRRLHGLRAGHLRRVAPVRVLLPGDRARRRPGLRREPADRRRRRPARPAPLQGAVDRLLLTGAASFVSRRPT